MNSKIEFKKGNVKVTTTNKEMLLSALIQSSKLLAGGEDQLFNILDGKNIIELIGGDKVLSMNLTVDGDSIGIDYERDVSIGDVPLLMLGATALSQGLEGSENV